MAKYKLCNRDNYLAISDLQIPFEADGALDFCKYLKKHFKIPDDNVLNVGDETDQYFGSQFKKSPNARHTPNSELADSIERLHKWYDAFPKMKLAISNHGVRWWKRALEAEIPAQLMRDYKEVVQAPKDWVWKQRWDFKSLSQPFSMIHGMGYSGKDGARNAAIDLGVSVVIGHLHSHAGIAHIKTDGKQIWGMNSGCLINVDEYAFEYGKDSRAKPTLGASVILDSGRTPLWVPFR